MSIALCLTTCLLFAGHTSTQTPQPVQSSGATWTVSAAWPFPPGVIRTGNDSGAAARTALEKRLVRIAAWGQTIAHNPHSMQRSGSQIGIWAAMFRFSNLAV